MAGLILRTNGAMQTPFDLAQDFFGWDPFRSRARLPLKTREAEYLPSFNVKETKDAYVIEADLPGVDADSVDLSLHKGQLTIRGSRQAEEKVEGEHYHVYERTSGSFARTFALPENITEDNVQASLEHGVLRVTVGKPAEIKPKKIALRRG